MSWFKSTIYWNYISEIKKAALVGGKKEKKKKNPRGGLEGGAGKWCVQVIPQETIDALLQ